ncbi:hypothetical protein Mapa_012537 [Marchantia paleacea]|nr:hypothetical protein Mapa_012537 [Marchantia paleacea]
MEEKWSGTRRRRGEGRRKGEERRGEEETEERRGRGGEEERRGGGKREGGREEEEEEERMKVGVGKRYGEKGRTGLSSGVSIEERREGTEILYMCPSASSATVISVGRTRPRAAAAAQQ